VAVNLALAGPSVLLCRAAQPTLDRLVGRAVQYAGFPGMKALCLLAVLCWKSVIALR
jgi:hypothetical protein